MTLFWRLSCHETITEGIAQHFQRLMACRKRPIVIKLDEGERLSVLILMNAGCARRLNIIADDDRPIAHRHVLETSESIDRRVHVPDGAEVPGRLLL